MVTGNERNGFDFGNGYAEARVKRYHVGLAFLGAVLASTVFGCADDAPPIDRVGVNVVDKSVFTGSWYMSSVVIDVDHEASFMGTYPGDAATDFNGTGYTTMPRIRWVIDEDYLYAYRDYEIIAGIDGEPVEPGEHLGHPVAAWPVESHFDIKRAYNPVTGEEQNVIYEDTQDRRWYEREFMRVDWSQNVLPRYYGQVHDLYAIIGYYQREPSTLYVQDASDFPDSWRPQFHFMSCDGPDDTSADCNANDRDWAADYDEGELYSFSFVNQDILSPGMVPDPFTGQPTPWCTSIYADAPLCTTYAVYVRHSFLKISERRQYEALNYHEELMDQHGYFRLEQPTYDRATGPEDVRYGSTDFLNYAANRHNIWAQWHDDAGEPIPYDEREVRQIVWYSSPEMPAHLMRPSFDAVSQWNETYMGTVRELRGQDVPRYADQECQTDDPDGYCFCVTDPATGERLNPTCPGVYDPYETPDEARARLESGEPFDCYVEVPDGAEPSGDAWRTATDESFYGWFDGAFVGDECVMILRTNTCNKKAVAENGGTTDGLDCQERGDTRFKLVSYVDMGETPFLGVAMLRGDPVTGEIITGDANIGGGALDSYRTSALQIYDVLHGDVSQDEVIYGEDVRAYLANLNQVNLPAPPRIDFATALRLGTASPTDLAAVNRHMDNAMGRIERLQGPEGRRNIFSDLRQNLVGTDVERRLTENMETLWMAGFEWLPADVDPSDIPENVLDMASPLRNDARTLMQSFQDEQLEIASRNFLVPNEYTDWGAYNYVQRRDGWPRPQLEFNLNRVLYGNAQAHELGHCMGLRHDFGGNADRHNYFEDYYVIDENIPLPNPSDYDEDGTPGLSPEEQRDFLNDYEQAREDRELAGIDETMNSSIMEYTGQFYARARTRLGYYDHAAIRFAYGGLEVVGDNQAGLDVGDINTWNTRRTSMTYYHGGEVCSTDADCPYSAGGSRSSLLHQNNIDGGITQRCLPNPRGDELGGVCSNVTEDLKAVAATDSAPRFTPVEFRYCTDDRTSRGLTPGTLGWCNLFDEGDSYREIVRNFMEAYERSYIFAAFRRYRAGFGIGSYLQGPFFRYTGPLINIYQNMIYEYHRNPEYRTDTEPFGFYDQFLASADILNFYAKILATPDVGTYRWDSAWERYRRQNVDPDTPGAQVRVNIGLGRYFSSVYQSGLSGIYRVERVGAFYDKLYIVQMMALRGWQTAYTPDVPFFTNFYDVFPLEMQQIFSGMIRERPESYMPRLHCDSDDTFPVCSAPRIQYMDFYRGDCSAGSTTCRPDPAEVTYRDMPVVDGGASILLQIYAALFGLSEFSVYFDTTFQQQLFVCVEGAADCFAPAEGAVDDVDYVRFESDRYGKSFLAWQVEPTRHVANQTSIGFAMVKEAKDTQFILRMLQKYRGDEDICGTGCTPYDEGNLTAEELARLDALDYDLPTDETTLGSEETRLDGHLFGLESFFNQLIQLQRQIGIADIIGF